MGVRRTLAVLCVACAVVAGAGVDGAAAAGRSSTGPDGRIAYSAWDQSLNYDIYTVDPSNQALAPVRLTTDGRFNGNPDWSPDGSKIAFDGWAAFGGPRIQVMDTDPATDDQTVISEPCPAGDCYGDVQPAWSPNGTRIAFASTRPNPDGTENPAFDIYVTDATGEQGGAVPATRLTNDPSGEFDQSIDDSQPTWSPDGGRIAFLSTGRGTESDSCDLWVMDSRDVDGDGFGDNLTRLTSDESFNCDPFEDVTPVWSPNSNLIAFTSVRNGNFDVWVVNADDPTDLRNVTQTPDANEDQPAWSPDGSQVVFRSGISGAYELYSLPVPPPAAVRAPAIGRTAPQPTQLTSNGQNKQQADWGLTRRRPATFVLTADASAHGRIRSTPRGIACGADCAATFVRGAAVALTPVADRGYRFRRWGGDCHGTTPTCPVRMDADHHAIARFVRIG